MSLTAVILNFHSMVESSGTQSSKIRIPGVGPRHLFPAAHRLVASPGLKAGRLKWSWSLALMCTTYGCSLCLSIGATPFRCSGFWVTTFATLGSELYRCRSKRFCASKTTTTTVIGRPVLAWHRCWLHPWGKVEYQNRSSSLNIYWVLTMQGTGNTKRYKSWLCP